jgi:hypothetical protein
MKQFQKLAINEHGDSPRLLDYKSLTNEKFEVLTAVLFRIQFMSSDLTSWTSCAFKLRFTRVSIDLPCKESADQFQKLIYPEHLMCIGP